MACVRVREYVCVFKIQKKETWLHSAAEAGRAPSVPSPSKRAPQGLWRHRKAAEVRETGVEKDGRLPSLHASGCMGPKPTNKTHSKSLAAHVRRRQPVGSAAAKDGLGAGGRRHGRHGTGNRGVGLVGVQTPDVHVRVRVGTRSGLGAGAVAQ